MKNYTYQTLLITITAIALASCATTSELDEVKASVAACQETANQAKATADSAALKANEANTKINRAFIKAQQK